MNNLPLRRAFAAFHLTLGLVIFLESVQTVQNVLTGHATNPMGAHLAVFAALEAVAALLFIIPKTLRFASIALLAIFLIAVIVHGPMHELTLLVFAAGVLFVRVHGSTFSRELIRF